MGLYRYCLTCFRRRTREHVLRVDDLEPWKKPRGVAFLWWSYAMAVRHASKRTGTAGFTRPATDADLTGLAKLWVQVGERQAFLAISEAVRGWGHFVEYAAAEYNAFTGGPEATPNRPRIKDLVRYSEALISFWIEHDEVEKLIRKDAGAYWIAEALRKRYGKTIEPDLSEYCLQLLPGFDTSPPEPDPVALGSGVGWTLEVD